MVASTPYERGSLAPVLGSRAQWPCTLLWMGGRARLLVIAWTLALGCRGQASVDETTSTESSIGESSATESESESGDPTTDSSDTGTIPDPPAWDPEVPEPVCGLDEDDHPLLDAVLTEAGLDLQTFVFTQTDFEESTQYNNGVLGGDFALSWIWDTRAQPARAGCRHAQLAGVLGDYLVTPHPVAGMIRHLASTLDRPPDDATPFGPETGFDDALAQLCATVGSSCDAPEGELPPDLATALAPLLWAIDEGIATRLAMDVSPGGSAQYWRDNGGNMILLQNGPVPGLGDENVRAYMLGLGTRERLYRAAAQIAFAIEDVDWMAFAGMRGVDYRLETNAGLIVVRDAGPTTWDEDDDVLLQIDLGGDDEYLAEVASNTSAQNPVSLAIDLGGVDTYHYEPEPTPYDQPGLLPADADGRYMGDGQYGNYTLSNRSRQGAARNGIAMLFDLGGDDDHYQSLRASQGYAHMGVGVLFDDGGDDVYEGEAAVQGSAQYGIGLAVDAGTGADTRRSFTYSQGFGWVAGAGVLVDGGGDDTYLCDIGDPDQGGVLVYYSPQLPQQGNSSFCQGAGFGRRNDSSWALSQAGGIGILHDVGGNDAYDASVFAQGTGYWEGTGILSDAGGADRYDAAWYVQGGVAHYAVGMHVDLGDERDEFNQLRDSVSVNQGSGHDYSLGVLINEGGDDVYRITGLSSGASNCNGIGLFVDNGGDDLYLAVSDRSSGVGNISNECLATRPDAVSIGIMLDAGGTDDHMYPAMVDPNFVLPSNGGTWGWEAFGLPSEHGGGVDGDDETGIHG